MVGGDNSGTAAEADLCGLGLSEVYACVNARAIAILVIAIMMAGVQQTLRSFKTA